MTPFECFLLAGLFCIVLQLGGIMRALRSKKYNGEAAPYLSVILIIAFLIAGIVRLFV